MGCWSESCVVSGMEISDGDELYVALMKPSRYEENEWEIIIPPVRGTYDDYGGIDLTEDYEHFGLKAGENWRPSDDERGQPIYINADVFDLLTELKVEFPHIRDKELGKSVEADTIGEQRNVHLKYVMKVVDEAAQQLNDMKGEDFDIRKLAHVSTSLSSVFNRNVMPDASLYVNEEIFNKGRLDFSEFYKFYGRAYVLNAAQYELRKLFAPGVKGPQHSGEEALLQFNKKVISLTEERIKEFDNWGIG